MILDYIDGVELADDVAESRANELNSLNYLGQGLHLLY